MATLVRWETGHVLALVCAGLLLAGCTREIPWEAPSTAAPEETEAAQPPPPPSSVPEHSVVEITVEIDGNTETVSAEPIGDTCDDGSWMAFSSAAQDDRSTTATLGLPAPGFDEEEQVFGSIQNEERAIGFRGTLWPESVATSDDELRTSVADLPVEVWIEDDPEEQTSDGGGVSFGSEPGVEGTLTGTIACRDD